MNKAHFTTIQECRVCGSRNLERILSLGEMYVSDFLDMPDMNKGILAPLELVLCSSQHNGCGLLQLKHTVSNEDMYRNYWYRSGINKTMTDELSDIATKAAEVAKLESGDMVIDIGANDGTLLRGYQKAGVQKIGYEPARNLQEYNKIGTSKIFVDFFNHKAWEQAFPKQKAKVITAIGMFYDLDDPNTFVADIEKCLHDDGILIIQMMYLPFVLERNAFDGICHEHLEYYSLQSLEFLLKRHGLEVFDLEMREQINEGSIRVYVRKIGHGKNLHIFPRAQERCAQLHRKEQDLNLDEKQTYDALVQRILDAKNKVVSLITKEVASGKKVHGYAASTKGNTTLQFYGLNAKTVSAIADRNPHKWGKYTVGTNIPVISEDESREQKPDYYFVLAWHFLPEFISRESEFLSRGGQFILPMPEFRVIGGS